MYSKILDPRPYHSAGTFNHMEMSASLSERAAKALEKLPVDERVRFREEIQQYSTWASLPAHLKEKILSLGA